MKLTRSIALTRRQLLLHRLRTGLALLGIAIGVTTVIVMVAVGRGAEQEVMAKIDSMGKNLLTVSAGQVRKMSGRSQVRGTVTTLTIGDARAIAEECPAVIAAAPAQSKKLQVKFSTVGYSTTVIGTSAAYQQVRNYRLAAGSFFSDEDNTGLRRTAVIGQTVRKYLFGDVDPMDQTILIGKVPFVVIGLLEPKGVDVGGMDQDDLILIPILTGLRRVFNVPYLSTVYLQAADATAMTQAEEQVRALLRERHRLDDRGKDDDFLVQSQADVMATQKETGETFTLLIAGIAAISMAIGGIGILAIMLMSVRERVREIGLRMAVGAGRRDILTQFVSEAVVLSAVGGLAGVVFGMLGSAFLGAVTAWQTSISVPSVLITLAFSMAVGFVGGVYPARQASKLDPIEALRSQ
ncbi:MAG: ABC transporter permease [Candidatus Edwardsbacteria bacterium]|nr:ABC transporter permease [Candidatus Edwardsbacteria bacterium]